MKNLLLVNFFQLDKYLEMFPTNCLVEALMEGSTGVGTYGCCILTREGLKCFLDSMVPFLSSASMVPSPSSASSQVVVGSKGRGTGETMVLGGLFLWERSNRLVRSSLETRFILQNFIDGGLFLDVFFSDNLSKSSPIESPYWVIDLSYSGLKNEAAKTICNLLISRLVEQSICMTDVI